MLGEREEVISASPCFSPGASIGGDGGGDGGVGGARVKNSIRPAVGRKPASVQLMGK